MPLVAHVAWTCPAEHTAPFLHGLRFTGITPGGRDRMRTLLAAKKSVRPVRLYCALAGTCHTKGIACPALPSAIRDLSDRGAGLRIAEPVPMGTEMDLRIATPYGRITADAQVVWAEEPAPLLHGAWYGHGPRFFEYLDFVLQFAPPGPEEQAIRAKLARIGVGAGKTFHFRELSLEHKVEIGVGMKEGEKKVEEKVTTIGKAINGWRIGSAFGDRAYYPGDWLLRAAAAKAGIYGNDAVEAKSPMTRSDATGQPLDGSRHKYTLTFPAGQLPPVNAFWSVTMYHGKTQLLIENPINRYLINSPMLPSLTKNPDGSVTLYIQKDSPGAEKDANWLPAPNGPIYLLMRLYWPKTEPPSILPPGAGTWNPPGIMQAD